MFDCLLVCWTMIVCFVCENLFVFWHNEQTETNKPPGSIQKFEEKPYFEKENHLNGIDSMEKKVKNGCYWK